jgi:pyruvate/2-oxoglutarate dehydrogenase complex dihydrolipoamide acyltransferase (E2) component
MPKLGFSVNEANLVKWLVADGDLVKKDQPLYEIESEKSVQEIEAPADGRVRLLAAADAVYAVGTVLAEIE